MTIESMLETTIGKEGRYSNHPADRGGETMWGITERVARRHGYTRPMRSLPRAKAVAIYRQAYAIHPVFAAVPAIDPVVCEEFVAPCVTMAPAVPSPWFQPAHHAY